jgi:site-specific DNA-methyltransferase (adenine-specific)/adenine-specific DNA-methyltransferase
MPTLNWIGKEAVVKHHKEVPFRLLEPVPELSCGDTGSGNLIVQGDNLHALKALLPRYAGQVKCIYIDPPYNTGNEGWVYNDNVNSPEIRKWLGEVVGKEGETLDRHDRWLCMMYPRLVLLKQFLREDGAIFVSIDDNEVATLRLLMDEIFGAGCFVSNLIWQKKYSPQNDARFFSEMHDHILVYSRTASGWKRNLVPRTEKQDKAYKNPDNDSRGPWKASDLTRAEHRDRDFYGITTPSGKVVYPAKGRSWSRPPAEIERLRADKRLWFGTKGDAIPSLKRFLCEVKDGVVPTTIWERDDVGDNQEATQETKDILGERSFSTPKPYRLVQRILQIATDKDSLILDSFAGSGTTAHAVLKQNAEDGGNRRFILVEMDDPIAQNVTRERVKRVAEGYTNAKGQAVAGLGGGFQFCRLSAEPLFDAEGQIRRDVTFAQLAEFVWFAETGTGYTGRADSPLLGVHEGRAIYLLYNGILKDRSVAGGNVLTGPVFEVLPKFAGPKVIYAAANRMGARTAREGITFKQTPYALDV